MGKILIIIGILCLIVGILLSLNIPIPFGKMPGDLIIKGKYGSFYFPIVTCLILSLVFSLLFYIFSKM